MGIGLDKRRFFATKPHRRNDIDQCFIPDDVTLNNTIKMILLAEPLLFDSIVCVNTVDQVVTLSGYVDSMIEKDHLEVVVLELSKYVDVINTVEIMPRLWQTNPMKDTDCDEQ
jgi:hypothetical protein